MHRLSDATMYMPDPNLASEKLDCSPFGRLLLFDVYDLTTYQSHTPYDDVVRELAREGSHRNVFLVDNHDVPRWRIADYPVFLPHTDGLVGLRLSADLSKVIGTTFQGHIFEIELKDGSLKNIGWTK